MSTSRSSQPRSDAYWQQQMVAELRPHRGSETRPQAPIDRPTLADHGQAGGVPTERTLPQTYTADGARCRPR